MYFFDEGKVFRAILKWASACVLICAAVFAEDTTASTLSLPAWWTAESTRIIDPNAAPNNYAPVNIGQLKHVALMAIGHFESVLGESQLGDELTDLKTTLLTSAANTQINNKAPANLGQAKAIIKPFYDRMNEVGIDPVLYLLHVGYPADWDSPYPFKLPPTQGESGSPERLIFDKWVAENYKPINIGQLKAAFAFDLTNIPYDLDGVPLNWILGHFGTLAGFDPVGDTDGDGLVNREEYAHGTDPKNPDTNGNGFSDGWEINGGDLSDEDAVVDKSPLPPLNLTIKDIDIDAIKLEWGSCPSPQPTVVTSLRVWRDNEMIAVLGASARSYTDDKFSLPEEEGITYVYSIEAVNSLGYKRKTSVVAARVGDFVETIPEISVKQWKSNASGGIPGFKESENGEVNYYNRIDAWALSSRSMSGYSTTIEREDSDWLHGDGTGCIGENYHYSLNETINESSHTEGEYRAYFNYKSGYGKSTSKQTDSWTLHKTWNIHDSRSEDRSGSSDEGDTTTPEDSEYELSNYSSLYHVGDDATETKWLDIQNKPIPDSDGGYEYEESLDGCGLCSGFEGYYYNDYHYEYSQSSEFGVELSEKITPEVRGQWLEELLGTGAAPGFGETKIMNLGMEEPIYGSSGSVFAELMINNYEGKIAESVFRYRVNEAPPKGNRFYFVLQTVTTPYAEGAGARTFANTAKVEERTVHLSPEFTKASLVSSTSYPSGEIKVAYIPKEGESKYGSVSVLVSVPTISISPVLKAVTFANTYDVRRDDGSLFRSAGTPHWQMDASGVINSVPIAFRARVDLSVETVVINVGSTAFNEIPKDAKIVLTGTHPFGKIQMRATGADIHESGLITFSGAVCMGGPDTVDYFESLAIDWSVNVNGGESFPVEGKCATEAYVTRDEPLKLNSLYETVLYTACKSAKGLSERRAIVNKIWDVFKNRNVTTKDGKPLQYYGKKTTPGLKIWYDEWDTKEITTLGLLKTLDGQCGAWANFFVDTLLVHRLDVQDPNENGQYPLSYVKIFVSAADNSINGIITKTWKFSGDGKSGDPDWPYINIYKDATRSEALYEEVILDSRAPGQNSNVTPASFNRHLFVEIYGYKDPSYGIESPSDLEMGISGCYFHKELPVKESDFNCDFNKDGNVSDIPVMMYVTVFKKSGVLFEKGLY